MFTYIVAGSGSQTIQIPYGNVAITTSGNGQLLMYDGNNANGAYFSLPKTTVETLVLKDFCGGTFTVQEVTGESCTLMIYVYKVTGGY